MIDEKLKKHIVLFIVSSFIYNLIVFVILLIVAIVKKIYIIEIMKWIFFLFLGFLISALLIIHMANSINNAIDIVDEKKQQSYAKSQSLFRLLIILLLSVVISIIADYYSSLLFIVGIFGIKFGAYINILLLKIIERNKK